MKKKNKIFISTYLSKQTESEGMEKGIPCKWKQRECQSSNTYIRKSSYYIQNILAWRIPGTEEPGGLPSMASHRVGHD